MALAKLVMLKFMVLLCLSLCFGHRVTMNPENAEKPNIVPSHVETVKIASRSSVSSSNNSGNGDEIPAGDCTGGLGFYEYGPGSCCCEYCGAVTGQGNCTVNIISTQIRIVVVKLISGLQIHKMMMQLGAAAIAQKAL